MQNVGARLFTAQQLAWHYRVSVGTIYRWVSEDKILGYGRPRARRYDLAEIQAARTKRHNAPTVHVA